MKLLDGLCTALQKMRDEGFNSKIQDSGQIAECVGIEASFSGKRNRKKKRMDIDEAEDDSVNLTPRQKFYLQMNQVLDTLLTQIKWRFEKTKEIVCNFSFLYRDTLKQASVADLKTYAEKLAQKYDKDLNTYDIKCEIESFKYQAPKLHSEFSSCSPIEILQMLYDFNLIESYPNIHIALRIFLFCGRGKTCRIMKLKSIDWTC